MANIEFDGKIFSVDVDGTLIATTPAVPEEVRAMPKARLVKQLSRIEGALETHRQICAENQAEVDKLKAAKVGLVALLALVKDDPEPV
ncbi:MAG: hypothetical protein Q8S00_32610 [Deltaproteobacteria bacterium]|nr:hypothetical protein [Deltaproteobacteria bacterium]